MVVRGQAKLAAQVYDGREWHELFYSVPEAYSDWFATDRCDGFVVGLLLQAMERKQDVHVEGPLSSRLFHSLQNFFIPMVARAFPNLHQVTIIPLSLTEDRLQGRGVATGFSGGIDSLAAVIQHFVHEESRDHKISHLLFNNAGSHAHGKLNDARSLFWQRFQKVQDFGQELNLPVIAVDSNVAELFPIDFIKTHSALNASIPLVLQNGIQRFYYASAYAYADCGVERTDDFARFDPLTLHLFSTESLDCVSTGCQMSRVEKTRLVATYEPSHRHLNVCVDPAFRGLNCSVCFKCRRTLLTLELLGVSDRYKGVFDLEKFRSIRRRYLLNSLRYKEGSFEAEVADLYREKGHGPLVEVFKLRRLWDRLSWR